MNLPTVTKIMGGMTGKPGFYQANFDPTTLPTNPTLLKAAVGSIVQQYAEIDEDCVSNCLIGLWQKTCESDCDSSAWAGVAGAGLTGEFSPHMQIQRTSKVGLKVTLLAEANPIYAPNAPLTYLWSGAGLTFGTGTAATTTVTAASPGAYTANLLVTDADGQTFTSRHDLKLDRVIEVGGANREVSNYFATLTAAIAWRTANDAAQTYKFIVVSDTTEPAMIANLDRAHIVWLNGATTTFAADARGFTWADVTPVDVSLSAESNRPFDDPCIVVTGLEAIFLDEVVATNMRFTGLSSRGIYGIYVVFSTDVHLKDCSFSSNAVGVDEYYNAHFFTNMNLTLERCSSVGPACAYLMEYNNGRMVDCYGEVTADAGVGILAGMWLRNTPITRRFDIVGGRFISNIDGLSSPGTGAQPRCAILLDASGDFAGLTVTGASAINRVVGGLSIAADAALPGLRFAGVTCVGAWLNAAPVAGTASGQNHTIVS